MRAVVFGGAGFVGSHVADALAASGHEVIVYDLKPSPYLRPGQRMIVGDILDAAKVAEAVRGAQVLYNFAGVSDIDEARHLPVETVQANILGTVTLLEAAREAEARRFVLASTIYVYSHAGGFYRASKQACESYVEEYQREYGLPYTILRYGTLYGLRADMRNSVHRFLCQAITDRKIVYYGDGDEMREYIHAEDAARCSVEILDPAFENQHVILTGQQPMRVRDLMTMIREILGDRVEVEYRQALPREEGHYKVTPYSFQPKVGRKLVSSYYVDMGQGLLSCLEEVHARLGGEAG